MHILIGALVGGVFAAVVIVAAGLVLHRKITAKNILLGVLGGAIAGAVTTATLGASSLVGVGVVRQAGAFALGGAAGGAAERATDNALEGRPLHDGVARATAIGGGTGIVSLGLLKGSGATLGRVAPALTRPASSPVSRFLTAPVPGTGGGIVRTFDEAEAEADADALPADVTRSPKDPEFAPPEPTDGVQHATQRRKGLSGRLGL